MSHDVSDAEDLKWAFRVLAPYGLEDSGALLVNPSGLPGATLGLWTMLAINGGFFVRHLHGLESPKWWKDVEGCGRMWKDVEGCGRMWKGCGRMWKDVEG